MIALSELITPSDIYWLTRLDGLIGAGVALMVSAGLATFAVCMYAGMEDEPKAFRWLWLTVPLFLLGGAVQVFVPTTREAIAIVVVPKIANNEDVQGLGADTVKLAREWLEELRPQSAKDGAK